MSTLSVEEQVTVNYRHNFLFMVLDGAFFWFSFSFLSPVIILPLYVSHFTTNAIVISLIAAISSAGYLVPQLFAANWTARFPVKKVLPVNIGFFSERLPTMLMAPAAWFLSKTHPVLAVSVFLLLFTWSIAGAGMVAVGYADMMAKVLPVKQRGLFFGLSSFLGTIAGVLGAGFAAWLLGRYPFPMGYVIAFALSGFFSMCSWVCLAQVREPAVPSTAEPVSQLEYFKSLPEIIRTDRNFANYLISQMVISLGGMASGFVVIYAVTRWTIPDQLATTFLVALQAVQAIAVLGFGLLADRRGYKLVIEISAFLAFLSIILAAIAPSPGWFYLIYSLRGASAGGFMAGGMMIALEFGPPEIRPTYIGLNNTLPGIINAIGPLLGGWMAGWLSYPSLFLITGGIGAVGFILMHWTVREPRDVFVVAGESSPVQEI